MILEVNNPSVEEAVEILVELMFTKDKSTVASVPESEEEPLPF